MWVQRKIPMSTSSKLLTELLLFVALFTPFSELLADYDTIRAGESISAIGGPPPYTSSIYRCKNGYVLRGVEFLSGSYIHRISLVCQAVNGNSVVGDIDIILPNHKFMRGIFPLQEKQVMCPKDHRVSGIKVQAGSYLDRVNSIRCTRYRGTSKQFVNVGAGGTGGVTHRLYCDGNEDDYLLGFKVQANQWIDNIRGLCR